MTEQNNTVWKQSDHLSARLLSPDKLFVFWQLSEEKIGFIAKYFNIEEKSIVTSLRLLDGALAGQKTGMIHEMVIRPGTESWLFKGLSDKHSYYAELGIIREGMSFFPLLRSNTVSSQNIHAANSPGSQFVPPQWDGRVSTYTYYDDLEGSRQK